MLHREQLAGAGKAGLHLVRDQKHPVVVAQRTQFRHEALRHLVEPAFALHGFHDDGSHARRFQIGLEQLLQRLQRVFLGHAVQGVREGQVPDIGHHRPEARLVGLHLAGQRHAHEGAPVKPARKADDAGAARVMAGDLDRVFHRLGAGGGEDRLLFEIARDQAVQPFRKSDIVLVWHDLVASMGEAVQLRLYSLDHLGVAVAGVHHRDPSGKVDIAVAVLVPDLGVLGTLGIDLRRHAHPARDRGILAVGHGGHRIGSPLDSAGC